MTNTMKIIIREETSRKLSLDSNPRLQQHLINSIETFCTYNFRDAVYALSTLLYEDDKYPLNGALMKLNFTLYAEVSFNPEKNCLFIEKESIIPIAEELQFQYMVAHPTFLKIHEYPQCKEELEALKHALSNHPLLLHRAVNCVWHSYEDTENVQNCLYLLLSEKDTSQAKGLDKLGIKQPYQRLLIPYAKEIALFLKAMNNAFKEEQQRLALEAEEKQNQADIEHKNALVAAANEELNSPFAPLAKIWDKVPAEAEPSHKEDSPSNVAAVKCSFIKEYSVSPELSKFLDNKEAITFSIPDADKFWEQLARLRKDIGIDLNFLVDNLQVVIDVLSAHENLETATASLTHAEHEHSVAMKRYTSNCSKDNLHLFVTAAQTYQDAKDICNAAREVFAEKCNIFEKVVKK